MSDQAVQVITADVARERYHFEHHRKTTLTEISTEPVPPGVPFDTPEGLKAEDEATRIAFDAQGGVYPIRESVYQATYEPVAEEIPGVGRIPVKGKT